jgi:hypothetical protein
MPDFLMSLKRRFSTDSFLVTWIRDACRMRRFVQGAGAPDGTEAGLSTQVGVIVAPWCGSAVPWFSTAIGLLLAARGHRVTFVIDDLPFGPTDRVWRLQLMAIRAVMAVVGRRHRVARLGSLPHPPAPFDANRDAIERLVQLNGVWALRGESPVTEAAVSGSREQLLAADVAIGAFLRGERFDLMFVPGGVWGTSGLWLRHARAAGTRVSTYDSGGYGVLLLAVDGVACQLQDIPRAFTMLKDQAASPRERGMVVRAATAEIDKRRAGKDKFASQVEGVSDRSSAYEGGVLIALNSSWDSAALGLHSAFGSTQEWIVETVRHLLAHTSAPVLVRQHPVERLEIARSNDDYRTLLHRHFGNDPRLHFIAAEDPVNSYDLMEQVCAVVVYTSTVGVEAAAQGKVVITESTSYYADLGFVHKATTPTRYFQLLEDAAGGRIETSAAMRDDAIACYYITQCCNWVHTPLTVPDFPTWSQRALKDLAADPAVQTVIDAIERNVPVAFLNHLGHLAAEPAAQAVVEAGDA